MRRKVASIVLAIVMSVLSVGVAHASPPKSVPGCQGGIHLFVQNQFEPFGALARRKLELDNADGNLVSVDPNVPVRAVGWKFYGDALYPQNPPGIRGEVWYKVLNRFGARELWFADAALRRVPTLPAPGNRDEFYDQRTQAAPRPPTCELK